MYFFGAIHIDTMLRYISSWEVSSKDNTTHWSLKLIVSCVNLEWTPSFSHSSVFPVIFCFFFFFCFILKLLLHYYLFLLFLGDPERLPFVWKTRKLFGEFKWKGSSQRKVFGKKIIPFEVLPFPRFYRNDRNFLYH